MTPFRIQVCLELLRHLGQEKDLLTAKWSLEETMRKDKAKFLGQVLETGLEREGGKAVYEMEIANATGVATEVKVDTRSG